MLERFADAVPCRAFQALGVVAALPFESPATDVTTFPCQRAVRVLILTQEGNNGSLSGATSLSSRRAVLLHALDTVDALVDVCGDFLSSKVAEDLWPLLKASVLFLCVLVCLVVRASLPSCAGLFAGVWYAPCTRSFDGHERRMAFDRHEDGTKRGAIVRTRTSR